MFLMLAIVSLVLIPQVVSVPKRVSGKETVAISAIEYSRKWEPFLGHQQSLPNNEDWKNLHDEYQFFHEKNDVIITGHVVKIIHIKTMYGSKFSSILGIKERYVASSIYLEGIDSTNEYGFKCNVYLSVAGDTGDIVPVGFLSGIPQEQISGVQVGDIVSVSYEGPGGAEFEGGMFCVNHNDWDNQKSRIDSRLHEDVREHAKDATRYKNRTKNWWKENGPEAEPKFYRISEYDSISYDMQVAESIQQKLAKKIRKQYEDQLVSNRESFNREKFGEVFNNWNIENIIRYLTTMRDISFRIKVCGRKFTDVVRYKGGFGNHQHDIPTPPKISDVGYVWHWNPDDETTMNGFHWISIDLAKEIIEFLDKYPAEDTNATLQRIFNETLNE